MKISVVERRWAHLIFDTIFPRNAHPNLQLGAEDCDIEGYLDEVSRVWPAFSLLALRATLLFVILATPFVLRRPRSFAAASPADRERVLDVLYSSPIYYIRGLVVLMKALAGILYGSDPAVRATLLRGHARSLTVLTAGGAR